MTNNDKAESRHVRGHHTSAVRGRIRAWTAVRAANMWRQPVSKLIAHSQP
eukprot:SAG31_NODE_26448_length_442_cov_0.749271_1_plen_49_part_10